VKKSGKITHNIRSPAVIWNTGGMVTMYGTVLTIEVTQEEIRLLLGSRTVRTGLREETIMVSDRIIMNLFTAKRLFFLLRDIMVRHKLQNVVDSSDLRTLLETTN
jgi:hypothetical protein